MGFPITISRETNFQTIFPYYIAVYRHIRLWNKVTYKQKRKHRPNQSLRTLGMGKVMSFARAGRRTKQHTWCNAHALSSNLSLLDWYRSVCWRKDICTYLQVSCKSPLQDSIVVVFVCILVNSIFCAITVGDLTRWFSVRRWWSV